jgi:hypothetical protein
VAAASIPDEIRLRRARGAQAPDAWAWIKDERERYTAELDEFESTPVIGELVDIDHLRASVLGWHWGSDFAPLMVDLLAVHRVLALARFVRFTTRRLVELPASEPPPRGAE